MDATKLAEVSVFEAFRHRSESSPDTPLYTIVDDGGNDRRHLTVRQTCDATDAVAGFLVRECGLRPGDRAVLAYTPSMEFVTTFIGCMRAGVVPVPVPPPDPSGRNGADRVRLFSAMCEAVGAKTILANRDYVRRRLLGQVLRVFRGDRPKWPELPWHTTDGLTAGSYEPPPPVSPADDETAYVQFTSGATGDPKGVRITHGNLRHQLAANAHTGQLDADARLVFWVPHFHDLCLITGILSALSGNGHLYLISPLAFVRRPAVWFEVMSRVRATHTAAPNLAFELAVRKTTPEERQRWDLSSLRVVMTAAEPVRPSTVRAFYDAFAGTGLRYESLRPAYGLAEHCVGVAIGRGGETLRVNRAALEREGLVRPVDKQTTAGGSVVLMSCGKPLAGVTVWIVDPETRTPLPEGSVGEIWVSSPSVAGGYVGPTADEPDGLSAHLSTEDGNTYLRTGDLGFLYWGELYFTGRRSDVIRLGSRTLYPQDLEETVRDAHSLIRPGCVVACPVTGIGGPGVAILAEVRATRLPEPIAHVVVEAILRSVLEQHREPCILVWLGRPGSIPKTTSGKLIRTRCRDRLAEGATLPGTLHLATFAGRSTDVRPRRRSDLSRQAWPR